MMIRDIRYPTKQQGMVWLKRRKNVLPSKIAKELKVSRPYVSKAQKIAEERIESLLNHIAKVNRVTILHKSAKNGFAVGYCPAYKSEAYITYSPNHGVNIWFDHIGDCESCAENLTCHNILNELATEWEIDVPEKMQATDLAKYLFNTIMRRLKWRV